MLNGGSVEKVWQPMSAEMWNAPCSRSISFIAENTGRSGQPMQNPGGRAGTTPSSSAARFFGAAQYRVQRVLEVGRLAFLDHQDGALAGAKSADLLGNERVGDVQGVDRDLRVAEGVGEAELLQAAHRGGV